MRRLLNRYAWIGQVASVVIAVAASIAATSYRQGDSAARREAEIAALKKDIAVSIDDRKSLHDDDKAQAKANAEVAEKLLSQLQDVRERVIRMEAMLQSHMKREVAKHELQE